MRRYLDVIHSLDPATGGPPEGLRQVAPQLRLRGWAGEAWCSDPAGSPWFADYPFPVRTWEGRPRGYAWDPRLESRLHEAVLADRVEVMVVHGLWKWCGEVVRRVARRAGVPYVVFPHGMLDPWFAESDPLKHRKKVVYWRLREERVLREAAAVVFTCDEERRLAATTFRPYRVRERVVRFGTSVTPRGDWDRLRALHARAEPALAGRRALLFLGRIHPKKGVDLLLDAWARRLARGPAGDRVLVLAGPGGGELVAAKAAALPEGARRAFVGSVHVAGMVRGEAKAGHFLGAEAFILPSHQENFGIAVAEALGHGLPVYLTPKVNIYPSVVEHRAGFVDVDDQAGVDRLVDAWWDADPGELRAMGARARACWEACFSCEAFGESFAAILDDVARGAGEGAR